MTDPLFPTLLYESRPQPRGSLFAELTAKRIERDEAERRTKLEAEALGRRLLASMPRRRLTVPGEPCSFASSEDETCRASERMTGSGRAGAG